MKIMSCQVWAVLSAVFAALTAIFAKIGVENINSDLATFIRTLVSMNGKNSSPFAPSMDSGQALS